MELKAVIFDLDGVLVTTDHLHFRGWKAIADREGMEFDETVNHRLRGVSRQESLRRIYEHNQQNLPEDAAFEAQCTEKNEIYKKLVAEMTPADVLPGALELLMALRKKGIKTAVASASRNAPLVLERTKLLEQLDAVQDGNNTKRSKPAPDVFLGAAEQVDVSPDCCIGVEDAAAGMEAILAAGMVAVGIGDQARVGAHLAVESVQELNVAGLREVFNKVRL